jgi:hypothetical protein
MKIKLLILIIIPIMAIRYLSEITEGILFGYYYILIDKIERDPRTQLVDITEYVKMTESMYNQLIRRSPEASVIYHQATRSYDLFERALVW